MSLNIKCSISYDGALFNGFQIQPNQRTVQGEIEKVLYLITKRNIRINASGRTDSGVHARNQVFNFMTDSKIPSDKWKNALNALLPDDIVVLNSEQVEDSFHARFDVKKKTYRYYMNYDEDINVFRRNYTWHYPNSLDIDKMVQASKLFLGEHDFTSFSSSKTEVENRVRTITNFHIWQQDKELVFEISGNGFMYNMVRIIIGTLVEVGRHKMEIEEVKLLFAQKNRNLAGITAPPQGLILWDVQY